MKIIKFLLYILCFFTIFLNINSTFALQTKVEDVFNDIDSNYKYLDELQSLYDRGMILADENWNFNPQSLLNRDEFVWIAMHVICRECIVPNTPQDLIDKYEWTKPFFDVPIDNNYMYCIADAKDNWYVVWYDVWYTCEDGTHKDSDTPFCIENKITLEEALAVLLRNSWIFTIENNQQVMSDISAWIITANISNDVSPKNPDWSVYTFYWYLKKALEYTLTDYDIYGKQKVYKLLEPDANWNLNPKKSITKEEFLLLAYITTKANSCSIKEPSEYNLSAEILIYEDECKDTAPDYYNVLPNRWNYSFRWDAWPLAESFWWLEYYWEFVNRDTWQKMTRQWKCTWWFSFPDDWIWDVTLTIIDSFWNMAKATAELFIYQNDIWLSVEITWVPISWYEPLPVDFTSIVAGWDGNYSYAWDFEDGNTSNEKNPKNTFEKSWVYEVVLNVKDWAWRKARASLMVKVYPWTACSKSCGCDYWYVCSSQDVNTCSINGVCLKDTDLDWIFDNEDKCVYVPWVKENFGCPILDKPCSWWCQTWYTCSVNWYCQPMQAMSLFCAIPANWSSIFWNAICDTCPCENDFDFIAQLRKCDVVFPAIVSPDWTNIYSKWNNFQVPYK